MYNSWVATVDTIGFHVKDPVHRWRRGAGEGAAATGRPRPGHHAKFVAFEPMETFFFGERFIHVVSRVTVPLSTMNKCKVVAGEDCQDQPYQTRCSQSRARSREDYPWKLCRLNSEHIHLLACLSRHSQPLHLPVHTLRTRSQIRILPTPLYPGHQT
jgi:hypothetical protein